MPQSSVRVTHTVVWIDGCLYTWGSGEPDPVLCSSLSNRVGLAAGSTGWVKTTSLQWVDFILLILSCSLFLAVVAPHRWGPVFQARPTASGMFCTIDEFSGD